MSFRQSILYFREIILNSNWEKARNIGQFSQSIATFLALITAAFWFFKRRQSYPKATLAHDVIYKKLDDDTLWIRLTINVKNIGDILLKLSSIKISLQYIDPLDTNINKKIKEEFKIDELSIENGVYQEKISEIEWPGMCKELDLTNEDKIIEPGESEQFHFDFILGNQFSSANSLIMYSYLRNSSIKGREIGWNLTTFHDHIQSYIKQDDPHLS